MPTYAPAFETGFGAAGAAAGGGFMDALGRLLTPLDYPRRALAGGANSVLEALETGDVSALVGALPAASGAILAGLVGGPIGLLAGSALGGAMFGAGEAVDPERFRSITLPEITGTEDFLPNFAVGLATDPLTFSGFGAGWRAGAPVGKAMGEGLEQAAHWRGPMYQHAGPIVPTDNLGNISRGFADQINADPRLMGMVPTGSVPLSRGSEAFPFLHEPTGVVTTIRRPHPKLEQQLYGETFTQPGMAPPPRPATELMNPAVRTQQVGQFRVEHSPRMLTANDLYNRGADPMMLESQARILEDQLARHGLQGVDLAHTGQQASQGAHFGNFGIGAGGEWNVLDPGSIHPLTLAGEPIARMGELAMREPRWYEVPLLKMLGSDRAIQREIESAIAAIGPPPALGPELIQRLDDAFVNASSMPMRGVAAAAPASDEIVEALGVSSRPTIPGAVPLDVSDNTFLRSDEIVEALSAGSSQRGMLEELASSLERPLSEPITLPMNVDPRTLASYIPQPSTVRRSAFAQTPWSVR